MILPVGGPIYQGALTAIEDSGTTSRWWVDADLFETDPNTQDVRHDLDPEGHEGLHLRGDLAACNDEFDSTPYVGTLENDGVGLAPFHNFEDKVSDSLQTSSTRSRRASSTAPSRSSPTSTVAAAEFHDAEVDWGVGLPSALFTRGRSSPRPGSA